MHSSHNFNDKRLRKKDASEEEITTAKATAEETTEEETAKETETETAKKGEKTAEEISNVEASDESTEIKFGTNQNDAVLMPMNTKLYGEVENGYYWFSFTTGSNAEPDYRMTQINKTADSDWTNARLYDEYGAELASGDADNSGTSVKFSLRELKADTPYYIQITSHNDREADYTINIHNPVTEQPQTAVIEEEEEELLFNTPFEINSTTVQFVSNTAEFIDKEAAKTAVKPVAGDINSTFVESEARKNRRVVVVDINDPIAQQILAAN